AAPLAAQQVGGRWDVAHEVDAGSELERYLRYRSTLSGESPPMVALRPWSAAVPSAIAAPDSASPWQARLRFEGLGDGFAIGAVRPSAALVGNTGFPYGDGDGPLWAGRGVSALAAAGLWLDWGPLHVKLEPAAVWSQNADFELRDNGRTGDARFSNAFHPANIDLPQRFGDGGYARLDPGQSFVRLDLFGATLGFSTANEIWGPGAQQAMILSANAPGFPHAFLGTAEPLDLWIARVHGRVIWGRLQQSDYGPDPDAPKRFGTGLLFALSPRGLHNLEVGFTRFFHVEWPEGGFGRDELLKPFEGVFKESLVDEDSPTGNLPDNQIASAFARFVLPTSGFEIYAEYAREDHNWDLRDFLLEPDHDSGYMLGARKAWALSGQRMAGVRAEVVNTRITHLELVRPQTHFYTHGTIVPQGHTHRGQVLGSTAAFGGGGAFLSADYYTSDGRYSLALARMLRYQDEPVFSGERDAFGEIELSALRFFGPLQASGAVGLVHEWNRDLAGDNAWNLHIRLGATYGW
ncbi:MAG: capsule assembly Wzi family protein, partial [Longimicrobiales bacterium]